ncbi:MAG: exosortase/archaeosortase family protein [Acidobacteriota bacterium]|nr:exosortase/archaeosortase family protein [Acidobacteriota bacterium]
MISWRALLPLLHYSLGNDDASHILLIPLVSGWLIYLDRRDIFKSPSSDVAASAIFLLPGIACIVGGVRTVPPSYSVCALGLVLLWISGFALAFGRPALQAARFPLLFLFLFIPLPEAFLSRVVYFLQRGSAEIAALLFGLTGLPVLREGFVFRLPRFSIEVARECSGIRSSIALLVLAILVGHFFLRKLWKQTAFVVAGIAVMILKNGIRIVTLTLLANYVDPGFLFGSLHRQGGVVFFMIGLLLLVPVFWLLQRNEPRPQAPDPPVVTGPAAVL